MLTVFYRFIVRPLAREPLRAALTLFAIALGAGVVLAIDLAGEAAAGSFLSSMETLAGDADLEVTSLGGVPESTAGTLATLPYPLGLRPRLEGDATLPDTGETVPLIGVDMVADTALMGAEPAAADPFAQEEPLWVGDGFRMAKGQRLKIQVNDIVSEHPMGGVISNAGRVIVGDIRLVQRLLRKPGVLDRILVSVPDGDPIEQWEARLKEVLPRNVIVSLHGSRTRENRTMLQAFRWNLRVLSGIALVVGAFLIYNTISVSVVRRRREIGILRALGTSRAAVLILFLAEGALFGLVGGVAGIFLGRAMAEGAVELLGVTVRSLYVTSRPAPVELTTYAAMLVLALGVAVAVLSALSPAREAASVAPVDALARGRTDYIGRVRLKRKLVIAALLACLAAIGSALNPIGGKPLAGYSAAFLLILAAALAVPALVRLFDRIASKLLRRMLGVEAMLASRGLAGAMRRTSVLVAALATAVAMMVSVGILVGSFRQTVIVWLDNQLRADLYIRPAGAASADRFPTLSPEIPDRIQELPMVRSVDRFRAYPISYNGLPATLAGAEIATSATSETIAFLGGDREEILRRMPGCECAIVSEPFANKHNVAAGSTIDLPFGKFHVLGVYSDYANERGYVIVDRARLLRHLPDPAPSSVAVWLKPGSDLEDAKREVERAASGSSVVVFANRALRVEALKVFDRTFAITYALEAIAVVVAVMGIAGALLALVIDRRRELGLIRFLGASAGQVRKLILCEAGLLGLLANVAGVILGGLLSLILIFVINKQSFGWTIQFHLPVAALLGGLSVVYVATLLAGLYPARIATRLNPIEVVNEE